MNIKVKAFMALKARVLITGCACIYMAGCMGAGAAKTLSVPNGFKPQSVKLVTDRECVVLERPELAAVALAYMKKWQAIDKGPGIDWASLTGAKGPGPRAALTVRGSTGQLGEEAVHLADMEDVDHSVRYGPSFRAFVRWILRRKVYSFDGPKRGDPLPRDWPAGP